MNAPGTLRGDQALYDGRHLIGYIRSGSNGVYCYDRDGIPIGQFADRKAAQAALASRAATAKEAAI